MDDPKTRYEDSLRTMNSDDRLIGDDLTDSDLDDLWEYFAGDGNRDSEIAQWWQDKAHQVGYRLLLRLTRVEKEGGILMTKQQREEYWSARCGGCGKWSYVKPWEPITCECGKALISRAKGGSIAVHDGVWLKGPDHPGDTVITDGGKP